MRLRSLLLPLAGLLATAHVVGVLTAAPILRHAEVLAVAVLLAYALLVGLSSHLPAGDRAAPRWALPAGLVVVAADAWRTVPVDAADGGYRWQILEPGPPPEFTDGLWTGLALTWAALFFVLLLAVVNRPQTDRRPSGRLVVGVLLTAGAVVGYAVFRLADRDGGQPGVVAAAVFAPLALALAALLLAALLLRQGRRLAAGGAILLVVAALCHMDAALAPYTLLPLSPSRGTVFTGAVVGPTLVVAPALAVAAELAGYLLLVAGLRPDRSERGRATGGRPEPVLG